MVFECYCILLSKTVLKGIIMKSLGEVEEPKEGKKTTFK